MLQAFRKNRPIRKNLGELQTPIHVFDPITAQEIRDIGMECLKIFTSVLGLLVVGMLVIAAA
ncbi:MAG: hypothetical protein ACKO0Z_04595 [Betaproteobacteria bacterium]